jgi:hypothetical protein
MASILLFKWIIRVMLNEHPPGDQTGDQHHRQGDPGDTHDDPGNGMPQPATFRIRSGKAISLATEIDCDRPQDKASYNRKSWMTGN